MKWNKIAFAINRLLPFSIGIYHVSITHQNPCADLFLRWKETENIWNQGVDCL